MISVIMGVFNTPKSYIDTSIQSILNQTYKDFEFIICNDCCTDDTFEYIKNKYHDKRIVWISNEKNMGLAYTLNHCLKYSKGEYIARMDTDDYSFPERFEKQLNILKNNKNIDIVNCNVNVFDDRGIYGARKYSEYIEFKDFLLNNPIVHPSIMGRKSAFSKVGNYRDLPFTMRNEDYDLFLRMLNKGVTFYTLQDIVFNFRENTQSLKRRKYKYRINEYMVKFDNFKRMNILPKYYIFCLKPLIVGLIPGKILLKIRNKTRSENKKWFILYSCFLYF